ncbi:unnamed protein product [Schistosoma bovis]|nr:unnamed protein product [Schistosoma bovis]
MTNRGPTTWFDSIGNLRTECPAKENKRLRKNVRVSACRRLEDSHSEFTVEDVHSDGDYRNSVSHLLSINFGLDERNEGEVRVFYDSCSTTLLGSMALEE